MTDSQSPTPPDLVALVGSRIAHDLISPLGAINNGVELLGLTGLADTPELSLITESVENANARIKTFRIAFGAAQPWQSVADSEIRSLIAALENRKLKVAWAPEGNQPRGPVKLAFLTLMCLESALPWGGEVKVESDGSGWRVAARAERMKIDEGLWALLTAPEKAEALQPAEVHFALLGAEAAYQNRPISLALGDSEIGITF